jgi:hypothetical protein
MTTHKNIAQWLHDRIMDEDYVYQSTVVYEIAEKFGEEYTYTNENGNLAIDKKVLKEFRNLKGDEILWDKSERCWHKKTDADRELERIEAELPKIEPLPKIDLPSFESTDFGTLTDIS